MLYVTTVVKQVIITTSTTTATIATATTTAICVNYISEMSMVALYVYYPCNSVT